MTTAIDRMKQEQEAQETEQLAGLVHAELEAVYARLDAARRVFRNISDDESASILLGAFDQYVAKLAVECDTTREEFLRSMGEMFDDVKEEQPDDPDAEEPEEPDGPATSEED